MNEDRIREAAIRLRQAERVDFHMTPRQQFVDAIGCAAQMAGILIGALVIWGLLIALFVGATNV